MEKSYQKTKFITGMRAFAALGVFLIHSGGGGLRELSPFTNSLVDFGKYGVVAFFVISAFTIVMSIDANKLFEYKTYLIRRFLRIAPAYYVICIIMFFLGGAPAYLEMYNIDNTFKNLFYHLTFINLFDIRYRSSLISVEWSIPIELFYYLILPSIFFYVKSKPKRIFHLLLFSLSLSIFSPVIFDWVYALPDKNLAYHWSLEKYFFTFIVGIFAYMYYEKFSKYNFDSYHIVGLILLLCIFIYLNVPYPDFYFSIWVGLLIFFCSGKSFLTRLLFENKIMQYLGMISFSFYLVHYPILTFLPIDMNLTEKFIIGLMLTTLASSILYYIIEAPFIKVGKKMLYNHENKTSATKANKLHKMK